MFTFGICRIDLKSTANRLAMRSFASQRQKINKRNSDEYEKDSPLDDIEDADYIDLSKLEQSSKEMYRNVELIREREKYLIVKQKYFKQDMPNFLSWNEKMKIRNLYNNNAEKWSIDKLSESFPALPYAISKIVKSKWMKDNLNKITRHDEIVEENWKKFRDGKLEVFDDLAKHLQNFTSRKKNTLHLPQSDLINVNPPKLEPPPNSFEAIIASYENSKSKQMRQIGEPKKLITAPINTKTRIGKTRDSSNILNRQESLFTVPGID